jgi:hypothetical protein
MAIEIKVPKAVQIRRLYDTGLDAKDIVKLTGYPSREVVAAIASGKKGAAILK